MNIIFTRPKGDKGEITITFLIGFEILFFSAFGDLQVYLNPKGEGQI
jgi:hypothetical protein